MDEQLSVFYSSF